MTVRGMMGSKHERRSAGRDASPPDAAMSSTRRELVEEAREIRRAGRRYAGDSTALVREDRDDDGPRR
ncbi:hypothetical protein ACTZWW_07150 [Salinarimonas sp. NSM]|uniref:hypothetical protein n=1 Tax=Salinarimonas sp. NSM TaxID=3458003 RepID=UPI004035637A